MLWRDNNKKIKTSILWSRQLLILCLNLQQWRKVSVSSLQKTNACQSFPRAHTPLFIEGNEPGHSDKLHIPRDKLWAKEDQNFPSGDMCYTKKRNIWVDFKNFNWSLSEFIQLVSPFVAVGGWAKWVTEKKGMELWPEIRQRSCSLGRCHSQISDKVIQLVS